MRGKARIPALGSLNPQSESGCDNDYEPLYYTEPFGEAGKEKTEYDKHRSLGVLPGHWHSSC